MAAEQPIPPGFLERARREADRYGDDPWILLRELVQNSRDAGAAHIAFTAGTRADVDELSCTDDGSGMSRMDVRAYLLRLYASGKAPTRGESREDRARGPVGRFGVGFWSVLRFSPAIVRVESRTGDEDGTGLEVDCVRGVLREVPCGLAHRGTRVTLLRPAREEAFVEEAERGLVRWAGAVRGLAGRPPPALVFNGAPRNVPLVEPELIAERLSRKGFDGVVGFGHRPSVALYSHGLLLRDAGSLEELLPRHRAREDDDAPGLYPVVRVNADGLEVLMNRREVVEDRLLEDLVRTAERRLRRLRRRLLDRLAPLRLLDRVRVAAPRLAPVAAVFAVALVAGALTFALVRPSSEVPVTGIAAAAAIEAPPPARSPASLEVGASPRINQPSLTLDGDERWDIRVDAPDGSLHLLKLTALSRYNEAAGLVSEAPSPTGTHAHGTRSRVGLSVDMALPPSGGVTALPVPSGHGVVAGSVLVDGARARVLGGADGEPLIRVAAGAKRVRYRTGPTRGMPPGEHLLEAPSSWPDPAAAALAGAVPLPPAARVDALARFVKARVRYTTSLDDAARFDRAPGSFVERSLSVGAGDCDVMNAVFALLLRAAGVPARVAVGLVAEGGGVAPDLHAWTEYYVEGRWRSLDVSPPLPVAGGGHRHEIAAPGSAHPHDALEAADDDASLALVGEPEVAQQEAPQPEARRPDARHPDLEHREAETAIAAHPLEPDAPTRSRTLAIAGSLALAIALLALGSAYLRARRRRDGDDEALAKLLHAWLKGARSSDPLHLRLRPFFPVVGSRRPRSLSDLERQAARGRLFAAHPDDPLLPSLRRSACVVDLSRPDVAALVALLPEAIRLEDLRPILGPTRDPLLDEIEATLRELDDGVRVHLVAGARGVQEVELPARAGALAPRHLLVGDADPAWRALADEGLPPAGRRAAAVRYVLERTTLYREHRAALLAHLAQEAP